MAKRILVSKFHCTHCGQSFRNESDAVDHETRCFKNPQIMTACHSCAHRDFRVVNLRSDLELPSYEESIPYCTVFNKFLKAPNNHDIILSESVIPMKRDCDKYIEVKD